MRRLSSRARSRAETDSHTPSSRPNTSRTIVFAVRWACSPPCRTPRNAAMRCCSASVPRRTGRRLTVITSSAQLPCWSSRRRDAPLALSSFSRRPIPHCSTCARSPAMLSGGSSAVSIATASAAVHAPYSPLSRQPASSTSRFRKPTNLLAAARGGRVVISSDHASTAEPARRAPTSSSYNRASRLSIVSIESISWSPAMNVHSPTAPAHADRAVSSSVSSEQPLISKSRVSSNALSEFSSWTARHWRSEAPSSRSRPRRRSMSPRISRRPSLRCARKSTRTVVCAICNRPCAPEMRLEARFSSRSPRHAIRRSVHASASGSILPAAKMADASDEIDVSTLCVAIWRKSSSASLQAWVAYVLSPATIQMMHIR
eukprot:m.12159 g.12159  ORF g.12159 m.12159 type:complete len:373 (+) comp2703_c0_seq2:311-1429(+)